MPIPRSVLEGHPGFFEAVVADAIATLWLRGDGHRTGGKLRSAVAVVYAVWASDALFAQFCYRAKATLQRYHVPLVPRILHRLAMASSQVCIGDPVVIGPGLYLPHGQVVVDGLVTIGRNAVLFPWTTIGLRAGIYQGPTLGDNVHVGTGAKLIGPIHIGDNVLIGANAVVTKDVPANSVVTGVPGVARRRRIDERDIPAE